MSLQVIVIGGTCSSLRCFDFLFLKRSFRYFIAFLGMLTSSVCIGASSDKNMYLIDIPEDRFHEYETYLVGEAPIPSLTPKHWDKGTLAISLGREDILRKAYIHFTEKEKSSALVSASASGNLALIKILNPSKKELNSFFNEKVSPVSAAVHTQERKAFEYLISLGADINASSNRGFNSLLLALLNKDEYFVNRLITLNVKCTPKVLSLVKLSEYESFYNKINNFCKDSL